MIQIIIFLISIIYAYSFCAYNRLPDYKVPKWVKKHFRDNKLSLNGLEELRKKQNNTIEYDIPNWVFTNVFDYNKPYNILQ